MHVIAIVEPFIMRNLFLACLMLSILCGLPLGSSNKNQRLWERYIYLPGRCTPEKTFICGIDERRGSWYSMPFAKCKSRCRVSVLPQYCPLRITHSSLKHRVKLDPVPPRIPFEPQSGHICVLVDIDGVDCCGYRLWPPVLVSHLERQNRTRTVVQPGRCTRFRLIRRRSMRWIRLPTSREAFRHVYTCLSLGRRKGLPRLRVSAIWYLRILGGVLVYVTLLGRHDSQEANPRFNPENSFSPCRNISRRISISRLVVPINKLHFPKLIVGERRV